MTDDLVAALTGEKKTLLITLYTKAQESRRPDSILQDRFAAEVIDRIDFDYSTLLVDHDTIIGAGVRAKTLDDWTRDFIAANRDRGAAVLHLGSPECPRTRAS
jgi:O-methyltransferase involved in polyketide biosynthesis